MKSALFKFPVTYSSTSDYYVSARVHAEAEVLDIFVVSREQHCIEGHFTPEALTKIKQEGSSSTLTDESWLLDLHAAMSRNDITVLNDATLEVRMSRSCQATFPLDSTPIENGASLLLDQMLVSLRVKLRPREFQRQIEELTARMTEVQHTSVEIQQEQKTLQESAQQARLQQDTNVKRIEELEKEIAQLELVQRSAGIETHAIEDEEDICRVRIPLLTDRKDINHDLFRLVKSKYISAEDKKLKDPEVRYCNVIMPMLTSEVEAATSQLGLSQKQAIWECLRKIDDWDYDVFAIQQQMTGDDYASLAHQPNGGSLLLTTYALLLRYGCFQKFNLNESLVLNWLSVVEAGYNPNPYHNSMHAADVIHITHYILSAGGLIAACKLSDEDIFAALFAATIHDYNHPGINNNFHIKAGTYLATLYNDRSILENYHVASVFELMKLPRYNILSTFSDDQRRDIRDTVVEMVLATDMGLHAKILGQFRRRLQENHDLTKKDDVRLALSMAVKMADISNCGRPERLYLKWCCKIADEFYMQGDRERTTGMPCSPFMDRMQPAMAKGQIAFMNYIVVPLFESVSELLPDMHFTVDYAENNKNYWVNHDDK